MKQILQNLKSGATEVADIPCPRLLAGHVLIRSHQSLVSTGTEKMLVDFGKANFIDKARKQPDKVRMVLDKVKTDGLLPTIEAVRSKLDQPLTMGYCNVGTVIEVGPGVTEFSPGDRVASNGKHAELVTVPRNLCAKIPDSVADETASFTVIGAIALQGIRLLKPTLGEAIVVSGLGIIGLMAVQLLKANGCRVLGLDFDPEKLKLAEQFGAETFDLRQGDPLEAAKHFSRGRGVDGVLITASTSSNEPVHQAALMSRKRGRIILVGVTGLQLSRADFYEKELSFQVSCSYGPGRYDPQYEQAGQDYPLGYVRWTEQRNFEAVLDMFADNKLSTDRLISHRYAIADAQQAYDLITAGQPALGILLSYPDKQQQALEILTARTVSLPASTSKADKSGGEVNIGFIGSGGYASKVLIPAFARNTVNLQTIASVAGVSSVHAGKKYGFNKATTDVDELLADSSINTVVIATRHDSHARLTVAALAAGKHVFVEKPLALKHDELSKVEQAYKQQTSSALMVGFNRRFAPHIVQAKALLQNIEEPKTFVMTVNAGEIPTDHWTQDSKVGGGRIIGEACHFIDLLRFLAASPITSMQASRIGPGNGGFTRDDKATITLSFSDGSIGTVHYFANGHKSFPKERLEIFTAGKILQLDNFRRMQGYGWSGFKKMNLFRQDKGNNACVDAFVAGLQSKQSSPIAFSELMEVSRATIDVVSLLHKK